MSQQKVVLITGASRGLGRVAAEHLARQGLRVFGTSRQPQPDPSRPYELLAMDVRDDASVAACVDEVVRRAGRIDVLINNAGYGLISLCEEAGIEQVKQQFETNFFGVVRVTNAVLPVMRRQLGGRIINVSSIAGLIGVPGEAYYCATKFALEGYTETLYYEVERFGIQVCLIEPGFFATDFADRVAVGQGELDAYDSLRDAVRAALERGVKTAAEPQRFADLVWRIIQEPWPRLRYPIGNGSGWTPWCKALLPMKLFACGIRRWFGIRRRTWKAQLHAQRAAVAAEQA